MSDRFGWRRAGAVAVVLLFSAAAPAWAQLGSLTGRVRDPQGAPVPGVTVSLSDRSSDFTARTVTDSSGRYTFAHLEPGTYRLDTSLSGFKSVVRSISIDARQPVVADVSLALGSVAESVTVEGAAPVERPAHSETLITQQEMEHIPGALQAGSFAALLETTPSTEVTHDLLHVRGGHQVGFEVDGVPVPSNSVTMNLALLFDPKDVKALEFQRGAYDASVGDRMYGVFNIVTRSGFERARGGEALVTAGQQGTVDSAVAYGDHSERLAWFLQGSANRTDFGLTPPSPDAVHDGHDGGGGAGKLWARRPGGDLFTVTGSGRADNYDVPHAPDDDEAFDHEQVERDVFFNGLWTHNGSAASVLTVSPYYHFHRAALNPTLPSEAVAASDDRRIHYAGARAGWTFASGIHVLELGANVYGSALEDAFVLPAGEDTGVVLSDTVNQHGLTSGVWAQDHIVMSSDVSIDAGVRWDRSSAYRTESMVQPRAGIMAHLPGTAFTAHAYVGRFFQTPPLESLGVAGSEAAADAGQAFTDVRAERNTLWQTGLTWTSHGAVADATYYQNRSDNFLDHEQLAESAIFLPVNIEHARLRGLEVTVHSPAGHLLAGRFVYSFSHAEGRGDITGGLADIDREEVEDGYFLLDHDQRHVATASVDVTPPGAPYWAHATVRYESGFLLGEGPEHLPSHATVDVAAGWQFGRRVNLAVEVQNLFNREYLVSLESEFNGTHYARPRFVAGRVRVRF